MNEDPIVTIGSDVTCDLRIDDPSVSGLHAQARLDAGGFLWLRDRDSRKGLHLKRNDGWARVRLVSVCAGDVLRFGDVEVETDRITRLFGDDATVRLGPAPEPSLFDARTGRYTLPNRDDEPSFSTPRRNPDTGGVEDAGAGNAGGRDDEDGGK